MKKAAEKFPWSSKLCTLLAKLTQARRAPCLRFRRAPRARARPRALSRPARRRSKAASRAARASGTAPRGMAGECINAAGGAPARARQRAGRPARSSDRPRAWRRAKTGGPGPGRPRDPSGLGTVAPRRLAAARAPARSGRIGGAGRGGARRRRRPFGCAVVPCDGTGCRVTWPRFVGAGRAGRGRGERRGRGRRNGGRAVDEAAGWVDS